jgi:3-hexulose-6-phosphate synthase/6-phospho-3-hexuloisomerase
MEWAAYSERMEKPVLQVALDFMHLKRALQAAREAVEGGADWVEAGTPLVKSEGVESVRALRKAFPERVLVADLKVMDTGALEVEIAAKAGANVITVMGVTDDATITEAVKAARRYGAKIMVDLMRVKDKPKRARELQALGVDYLNMHVSIDEQMIAHTPLEELKAVCSATELPVAVAGGLNSETVAQAVEAGARIIIVGGAIIKAEKVVEATRTIKKAIDKKIRIPTGLYKKYTHEDLFEAFRKVSTPNLADAMQKRGVLRGILPRNPHGVKMVGRALTVKTADGDWAKPVEAIDRAVRGGVIVVDVGGGPTAVWGELASWSCKVKGVAGVVIDGAARDIDTIVDIGFPCFSRHIAPHAGEPKGHGEIGSEIECGGQIVRTGDWIVGDDSGVVVVPQELAVEMANRALDVLERENRIREEIKRGGTLSSVLELEKWEKVG